MTTTERIPPITPVDAAGGGGPAPALPPGPPGGGAGGHLDSIVPGRTLPMPESPTESLAVQFVDPAEVEPDPAADPAARPGIDLLLASLEDKGQQVPVLLARHPTPAGPYKYRMIDGHGRRHCLLRLRRKMAALIRDRVPDEIEMIELEFSCNAIRRSMDLAEVGLKAERHMRLTGGTQGETAARLRCSGATLSRALAVTRRLPEGLRADAFGLGARFVSLIAPLPTPEAMAQAVAFATAPRPDGKRPSPEQVAEFVAELKRKRPTRAKRLAFAAEGRRFEVELRPSDGPEAVIRAFKAATARLEAYRKLPLAALAAALADREPEGPAAG